MGRFIMLVFALEVVLVVLAMISCLAAERGQVRTLPRFGWVIVILLVPVLGPVLYFLAGRPLRAGRSRFLDGLGRLSGGAAAPPTRPARSLAPDDDPEFLRRLDRKSTTDEQDVLRRLEDDLGRRDGDLRNRDDTPPTDS